MSSEHSLPPFYGYDHRVSGLDELYTSGHLKLDHNPECIEPNIFTFESYLEEKSPIHNNLCSDEVQLSEYVSLDELMVNGSNHGDITMKNSTHWNFGHSIDSLCQDLCQESHKYTHIGR